MEDTTTIDYNSKDKISSNINEKIADFQNEINQLKNISQLNNGNDKRQSVQLNKSSIISFC